MSHHEPTARRDWLDALLGETASDVRYPPAPAFTYGPQTGAPIRLRPGGRRLAFVAIAAVVAVFAATLALSHDIRSGVADFLGLAVEGERIERLSAPPPGATSTPFPTPIPLEDYATVVSVAAVQERVRFPVAYPPGKGEPVAAYLLPFLGTTVLILQYEHFDLWQSEGPGLFEKGVVFSKQAERVAEVKVSGRPGYWLANGVHVVRITNSAGTPVAGTQRTVTRNTLVWQSASGRNYRLEVDASFSLDGALTLAESLP